MPPRRSLGDRVTDSFRILTELDLSHAYERQAGTIALGVVLVLVLLGALVTGRRAAEHGTIAVPVDLPAAAGLARGDAVLVRGVRVGRVESIRLLSPGRVRVTLSVDEAHAPRVDADARLVALDLVGNQAVEYNPGRAATPLAADLPVAGSASVALNDRLAQLREQAAELLVGLRDVDPEALAAEVRRTRAALARAQAVARAFPTDSLAAAARVAAARGDSLIAGLAALRAAFPREEIRAHRDSLEVNAATLLAEVDDVQEALGRLREQAARQEGSAGRFRDTTFRHELDAARTSLRLLLEKFGGRRAASPPPP
ncbi:MAG TPA: MlaD family protein [Gemmatimonadales bacterium]